MKCEPSVLGQTVLIMEFGVTAATILKDQMSSGAPAPERLFLWNRSGMGAFRRSACPGRCRIRNRATRPTRIEIPIRTEPRAVIDATPTGDLTCIVSAVGRPFTRGSFGNWFRDRCSEAGLPNC
jgi:hypothetical protein